MRKVIRVVTILLGCFIGLILLAAIGGYTVSEFRLNKQYTVDVKPITIPTDAISIAEGKRISTYRLCVGCHGPDLGGRELFNNSIGYVAASNLTSGVGGIRATYSDEDWVRAIRHGIKPDGKALLAMPSHELHTLSDDDVGKIIAYIRSLPPINSQFPDRSISPLGRAVLLVDIAPLLPAEKIDHGTPIQPPIRGITREYGAYLATNCLNCHNSAFSGGSVLGASSGAPPAANLTPSGELAGWTEEQFITFMRTGKHPSGRIIESRVMPWTRLGAMDDQELKALWVFLQSLPPKKMGEK